MFRKKPTGGTGFGNVKMAGKLAHMATAQVAADPEVWPENEDVYRFFRDYCLTQWRVGVGGVVGLDYTAVLACLRTLRISRDRRDEMFADLRCMESGAITAINT